MKSYKILAAGAVLLALVSCSKSTRISGTLSDAPGREVIVKLLDVNRYSVLDTLTTDAQGRFSCKVDVSEGHYFLDRMSMKLKLHRVKRDTKGVCMFDDFCVVHKSLVVHVLLSLCDLCLDEVCS